MKVVDGWTMVGYNSGTVFLREPFPLFLGSWYVGMLVCMQEGGR